MKKNILTIASLAVFVLVIFPSYNADAIPAFARKYQISCQVCHSPAMPKLKQFGDEFAGNGFRLTEYESPRYFVPVGDDRLSLFREVPIALRMDGFVSYNFNNEKKADFSSPFVIKILSGGELSDKLSYYFYFLLNERGSIAGIEDAFLMYNDLLGSGINVTFGQFQASDPLYKGELRFTLEPYRIYEAAPGNSSVNLKYEKGIIFDKGFSTGTDVVLEILNGNGIGEASEGYLFDKDKYKNFMLRINQGIGKHLSVGVFGYTGKEEISAIFPPNSIKMLGPDISVDFNERLMISAQYLYRVDSHPFSLLNIPDVKTNGGFVEVVYSPKGDMSKWYLTGLFNLVESEEDLLDYRSATLHAGYLLRRNVRLVAEYTQQFNFGGRVNAGFVSAF